MHERRAALIVGLILALAGPVAAADCTTDTTLCLQDGRFLVEAAWKKSDGTAGVGHPVNLGSDSGYFWFLDPDNVELAVKALDGCSVNGRAWFFAGGLTNLEVEMSVTDTATGEIRSYANPLGIAFRPIVDTSAFGCPLGPAMLGGHPEEPRDDSPSAPSFGETRSGDLLGCEPSESILCIDGRFRIEASWETASGRTGVAHAVELTSRSGYFWFFDVGNVELLVKTLDACSMGRGQWFFAAGLTTVRTQIRVTDTYTGEIRTYEKPLGRTFLAIQDTSAFAFCPTPTSTPPRTHTPTPTPSPTNSRTPTLTPTRTPTKTPTPSTHRVSSRCTASESGRCLSACHFSPDIVQVRVGDSVRWESSRTPGIPGLAPGHSTTSGSDRVPDGEWDRSFGGPRITYTRTFGQAGTFRYYCKHHGGTGVIVVDP